MKTDPKEVKLNVLEELKGLIPHKEDRQGITVRCPLCGDSVKRFDHGHFHVKIDLDDDTVPLMYRCLRCDHSGLLNSDILKLLGIYDITLMSSVKSYNKTAIKTSDKRLYTKYADKIQIQLPYPQNLSLAEKKIKYLNQRLGLNLDVDVLVSLKVCLNLADFFKVNEISHSNLKKSLLQMLHENYIGFISAMNDFIVLRNISFNNGYRYYNYNVFNRIDKSRNFYAIPNDIDLMSIDDITIVLTEGIFDIISAFFNVFNCKLDNMVYAAVCGCGYESVIKYYLRKGLFGHNVHIVIISDQDKPPKFYTKLYKDIKLWVSSVTLYYNLKSKDIGVPKNEIELIERKITIKGR